MCRHAPIGSAFVPLRLIAVPALTSSTAVQLHNALIISIFDPSAHLSPATPPPDAPKGPPRKRRRLLPYQGPDPNEPTSLRSSRLKRWSIGVGRRERERIRNIQPLALSIERKPRPDSDEIARERGVQLLPERGGAPAALYLSLLQAAGLTAFVGQTLLAVARPFI